MNGIKVRPLDPMEEVKATLSSSLLLKSDERSTTIATTSNSASKTRLPSNHPTTPSWCSRLTYGHEHDTLEQQHQQPSTNIIININNNNDIDNMDNMDNMNNNGLPPLLSRDALIQRIKSLNSNGGKKPALNAGSLRDADASGRVMPPNTIVAEPSIESFQERRHVKESDALHELNRTTINMSNNVELNRMAILQNACMSGFSHAVESRERQGCQGTLLYCAVACFLAPLFLTWPKRETSRVLLASFQNAVSVEHSTDAQRQILIPRKNPREVLRSHPYSLHRTIEPSRFPNWKTNCSMRNRVLVPRLTRYYEIGSMNCTPTRTIAYPRYRRFSMDN